MAHYLVKAKPIEDKMEKLRDMLDSDEIRPIRPFGNTLHHSLDHARITPDGFAVWEELDYCTPPLAMERAAVIDDYFTDLSVENVDDGEGWKRIEELPSLWAFS